MFSQNACINEISIAKLVSVYTNFYLIIWDILFSFLALILSSSLFILRRQTRSFFGHVMAQKTRVRKSEK